MFIIKEGTNNGEGTPQEVKKEILAWLQQEGYVTRTKQEDKTFVDNKVQDEVDTIMSERNTQLTNDIKELTGVEPNENEKYYKYLKRAFNEKKQGLENEIKTLKEKGSTNDSDDVKALKEQISELESSLSEKIKEVEDTKKTYEEKIAQEAVSRKVESTISGFKKNFKDLDESVLNDAVENRRRKFDDSFKVVTEEDVDLVYDKKTNKPLRDQAGQPVKLQDHLKNSFNDLIDSKKAASGAGTGSGSGNGDNKEKPYSNYLSGVKEKGLKNQTQLYDYLRDEAKLDETSKDFNEAFDGIKKDLELPIR